MPMEVNSHGNIDKIRAAVIRILKAITESELQNLFHGLLDRSERCIDAARTYFE